MMIRLMYPGSRARWSVLIALLLVLTLTACNRSRDASSTATVVPTTAAVETPTSAPTEATDTEATDTETPTAEPEEPPADEPTDEPTDETTDEAAAPESPLAQPESPLAQPESPLAQPDSPLAEPTTVPAVETEPGTGALTGVLMVSSEQGPEPVAGMIIAVADALTNTESAPDAIAAFRYRPQESPYTNTDDQGFFAIANIPPGRYGLVLDLTMSSYILRRPGVNEDLVVVIEPDQQLDMGVLLYDNLPLE